MTFNDAFGQYAGKDFESVNVLGVIAHKESLLIVEGKEGVAEGGNVLASWPEFLGETDKGGGGDMTKYPFFLLKYEANLDKHCQWQRNGRENEEMERNSLSTFPHFLFISSFYIILLYFVAKCCR